MLQPSFDTTNVNLGDAFNLSPQGYIAEIRSEVAVTPNPHIEFVQGIDFIGGLWGFTFKAPFTFESSQDPLAEREDVLLDGNGTLWSPDVYLKANLKPLKDPDRWLITPSLRINTSILTYAGSITGDQGAEPWERVSLDPRLATRFNVSDTVAFKAALVFTINPPALEAVGIGANVTLGYERAWNSSFGIEHQVLPYLQWDMELFYRPDQLIVFSDTFKVW